MSEPFGTFADYDSMLALVRARARELQVVGEQFDDFAGLDLKGKVVVYITGGPSMIPGNLRSHYSFRSERWKAVQKTRAIGWIGIPNPKTMDIPWERAMLARA